MFLNKKEIMIFLTFFIIYSFFVHWGGANENSHFALTRAIVDEGRFEIDSFYNQTGDRAYYNGHYYSDKDPGLSFLSVPVYATWKFIYNFFPQGFKEKYAGSDVHAIYYVGEKNVPIVDYIDPGFFILISMILVTIFTSSLFAALTVVLMYKISRYFTNVEKYRLVVTIILGLGTLLFPYAMVYMEHSVSTFFAFFAFYLIFKVKQEKLKDNKFLIIAGISSGFAITVGSITVIISLFCLLYLFLYKKEKLYFFILGGFIALIPFLIYNYSAFGNPFTLPRYHLDTSIWPELGGIYGLGLPNFFIALRLMFDTYNGIFFYYPILLLSFVGLYYMYKKFKIESIIIIFIFFSFVIMNSSWWAWWGGGSFGPRHLTPAVPFLVIPLIYIFEKFDKKLIIYFIFILLFYSILVNFAGLQTTPDFLVDKNLIDMASRYKEKINTFQFIGNPLYDYYFPLFFKVGPRNRIFESIINKLPLDIRFILVSYRENFPYFYFHIPFLCFLPLIFILSYLWLDSINKKNMVKITNYKYFLLISILLIIALFLIVSPKLEDESLFKNGWYPPDEVGGRWMKDNGLITIYNNESKIKTVQIYFDLHTFNHQRELKIYFNGKFLDELTVTSYSIEYENFLDLIPGKNTINFITIPTCEIPVESIDCLSLYLSNFSLSQPNETILFAKNWYIKTENEDVRWMSNNGTILLFNSNNSLRNVTLYFYLIPFPKNRTVLFYLNDYLINVFDIAEGGGWVYTPKINLNLGENEMRFESTQNCVSIDDILKNKDFRCVSVGIKEINITDE